MTTVGLPNSVEVVATVLVKFSHELRDENVQIHRDGVFITVTITIAKASLARLIDEDHVGLVIPAVRVKFGRGTILVHLTGSELLKKANHTGAARSACKPGSDRVVLGVIATFKEPEKVVFILLCKGKVSSDLANVRIAKAFLVVNLAAKKTSVCKFVHHKLFIALRLGFNRVSRDGQLHARAALLKKALRGLARGDLNSIRKGRESG
mmetsp:Transcript_8395/g.16711  ORF Transcript_8395/g.16711 Transcript_8395/m.16711 type:complete len:208 (+) Transcript_8395:1024-1647(+)